MLGDQTNKLPRGGLPQPGQCGVRLLVVALLVLPLLVAQQAASPPVPVLDCRANANQSLVSGVWLEEGDLMRSPTHFTVCFRFQFLKLRPINILTNAQTGKARPMFQFQVNVDRFRVVVAHEYHYVLLRDWLLPRRWYHVCITRLMETVTMFLDGVALQNHTLVMGVKMAAAKLTIGYLDPLIYPGLTFIGNISQFNVWTKVLEPETIQSIAKCEVDPQGDSVPWEREWTPVNSKTTLVPLSSLCNNVLVTKTQLLPAMNFEESAYICEGMGGSLTIPRSYETVKNLVMLARSRTDINCQAYWSGMSDAAEEGVWRDHFEGRIQMGLPWAPDEPNGIHFENCAGVDEEGLADDDCERKRCPFCSVTVGRPWTLLGSCEASTHDRQFLLETGGSFQALGIFRGFGDYTIEQNATGEWEWRDANSGALLATLVKKKYNYPIGRQKWSLSQPVCDQTEGQRMLLLSVCSRDTFTCNDGTCIAISARCDHKPDCSDNSDEIWCRLLSTTDDYEPGEAPREKNGMLGVTMSVELETLSINTHEMLLPTTFNLTLSWHDPRLTFFNLKESLTLNTIPPNGSVWTPAVAFVNTLDHAATVVDERTNIRVLKTNRSARQEQGVPEQREMFMGAENPLISHRQYQTSFSCDFELSLYPFDHQSCSLLLHLQSPDFTAFLFNASSVAYEGSRLLLEYEVGELELRQTDTPQLLRIVVPLARRQGYAFINIYLPSLTMLVIGFLTLFFQRQLFDVRVMTALTTLLVMATLSSQVSASLPNTSYFKMVDIWLLFCIFATFLVIVFHVLIDRSKKMEGIKGVETDIRHVDIQGSKEAKHSSSIFVKSIQKDETGKLAQKNLIDMSLEEKINIPYRMRKVCVVDKEPIGAGKGSNLPANDFISEQPSHPESSRTKRMFGKSSRVIGRLMNVSDVEMSWVGQICIALVFVVFNSVYWSTIYLKYKTKEQRESHD